MEFVQNYKNLPVELVYYSGYNTETMRKLLITCLFHQLTIIVTKLDFLLPWNILTLEKSRTDNALLQPMLHAHLNVFKSHHKNLPVITTLCYNHVKSLELGSVQKAAHLHSVLTLWQSPVLHVESLPLTSIL